MGVPRKIGNVNLFAELTRGTATSVYKGFVAGTEKLVVVKLVREEFGDSTELAVAFKREASMLAKVDHPAVVRIIDFGIEGLRPYITTEYVEGATLRELIDAGSLAPATGAFIVLQALKGLHAIHKAGLLHRDIKPSNMIVSQTGETKLVDLGFAVVQGARDEGDAIAGTLAYLAPDLLKGAEPSKNSDLFAIGCTLFESLFGYRPYRGSSDTEVMNNILASDPFKDVASSRYVSPRLIQLCKNLLRVGNDQKVFSTDEAIAELENCLEEYEPVPDESFVVSLFGDNAIVPTVKSGSETFVRAEGDRHPRHPAERKNPWRRVIALSLIPALLLITFIVLRPDVTVDLDPGDSEVVQADIDEQSSVATPIPVAPPDTSSQDLPHEQDAGPAVSELPPTVEETPAVVEADPLSVGQASSADTMEAQTKPVLPERSILSIRASPWARVQLADTDLGITPLSHELDAFEGAVTLSFSHPDFPVVTREFEFQQGEQEIAVSLWESVGLLSISASPWAIVTIDGVVADTIPPRREPFIVAPGIHTLGFAHPDIGSFEREVRVEADSTYTLTVNMFNLAIE